MSELIFVFQALIYDNSTITNLAIELFDEDTDKDDFLGWYIFYPSYKYRFLINRIKFSS